MSAGANIKGVVLLLVTVYIIGIVAINVADRFTTSGALAINETENPLGYAAQQEMSVAFYDNMSFVWTLVFLLMAAIALHLLGAFGGT